MLKVKIKNKVYLADPSTNSVYTLKGNKTTKMQSRVLNKIQIQKQKDPIKMKVDDFPDYIQCLTSTEKTALFHRLYKHYLHINSQNINTILMTKKMSKLEQKLYLILES